jgi:hypothetical protein
LFPKYAGKEKVDANNSNKFHLLVTDERSIWILEIILLELVWFIILNMRYLPCWRESLEGFIYTIEVESTIYDSDILLGMILYICYDSIIATIDNSGKELSLAHRDEECIEVIGSSERPTEESTTHPTDEYTLPRRETITSSNDLSSEIRERCRHSSRLTHLGSCSHESHDIID